jgi:nucleoside-diphosphate-sugar epimerase
MTPNRILVTGSAGFLGSAIVTQASITGQPVTATDRFGSVNVPGVPFISADILEPNSLSKIFEGVDCVCHVAGLAHIFSKSEALTAPFHAVNVAGTENLAHAAIRAGIRHFVFVSSVSVYGGAARDKNENSECQPEGPYAESKFNAERCLIDLCQKKGMALTILRLATLYGEGDPGNVGRLVRTLDRGRFFWIGDGSNRKSLLYVGDAARACMAVAERPASGINIYNISAPPYTMREIVDGIASAIGKNPFPVWIPTSTALFLSRHLSRIPSRRMSDLHHTIQQWLSEDVYDTRRFDKAYGFQTKTSLEDGLKREVDWYRHNQETIQKNV